MVQSINTKVDLVVKATSHTAVNEYGQIMIGDVGFEFYNDKNLKKFIQIPWDEVDVVIASILFKGKYIPRFALRTKTNGTFNFSSRDPKKVLRAIREHIPAERIVKSLNFFQVLKRGVINLFTRKSKK